MFAGLSKVKGDCAVVMDCDLQHPPQTVVEMFRLWEQGYEVVEGVKTSRGKESFLHKAFANTFYKIISGLTGFDMANASDFKLLSKNVIQVLLDMPERKTFSVPCPSGQVSKAVRFTTM
jgi:dolichol-phosphate mannosyltransferase